MATSRRLAVVTVVLIGVAVSILLVVLVAPWANPNPDGLEKVSADSGIDAAATEHALAGGPFADYGVEGVESNVVGTAIAGVVGIVATFAVGAGVLWIVRRRRVPPTPPADPAGAPAR